MALHRYCESATMGPSTAAKGALVHSRPVHCTIIDVDMVGSSSRSSGPSLKMREDLRRIIDGAVEASGAPLKVVYFQDLGDGLRVLFPPEYPASDVLQPFLNELGRALREHRMMSSDVVRIRLRVAAHHGLVVRDATGWSGDPLVWIARMLEAPSLRQAVIDHPATDFVLIVSNEIYRDVVVNEYGPPMNDFVGVDDTVKAMRIQAWLYVPGTSPVNVTGTPAPEAPGGTAPRKRSARRRTWGLDVRVAVAGLVVAIVGVLVAVLDREVRCALHLDTCTSTAAAANGRVNMAPCLNMHTGPSVVDPNVECLPYNLKVYIDCTREGPAVTGPYGPSTVWDHLTYKGTSGYVADAWMFTGQAEPVAGTC